MVASRRELTAQFDRAIDAAERSLHAPLRESDWSWFERQRQSWADSRLSSMRFAPLLKLMAPLNALHVRAERYLGRRDGILVGIALELHRRRHGAYPASLHDLVPAMLPDVPVDRISGHPVRYRLIDGHPLVYSLGDDGDDDAGRPPVNVSGEPVPMDAAGWGVFKE